MPWEAVGEAVAAEVATILMANNLAEAIAPAGVNTAMFRAVLGGKTQILTTITTRHLCPNH